MLRRVLSIASLLSFLLGLLSLIVLAKQGLLIGIAAPFEQLIQYYQKITDFFLGWADTPIENLIDYLEHMLNRKLHFDRVWKHIFILLWLYFGSDIRINLRSGRYSFGLFSLAWGSVVAIVTSVVTAAFGFSAPQLSMPAISVPIIGIIVFDLFRCIWGASFSPPDPTAVFLPSQLWIDRFIRRTYIYVVPTIIIGCLILFCARTQAGNPLLANSGNPHLIFLIFFFLLIALYWIARGGWLRITVNQDSDMMNVGILMLAVILGALVFLLLNAGLGSVGL
jgi:hypothetical protein